MYDMLFAEPEPSPCCQIILGLPLALAGMTRSRRASLLPEVISALMVWVFVPARVRSSAVQSFPAAPTLSSPLLFKSTSPAGLRVRSPAVVLMVVAC